jgi:tRNA threonylcarbamoyladenosine biosynthesis protein TsaB
VDARLAAIDTSTERLVLAVQGPAGMVALDEPGGARASARLLPALLELLAAARLAPTDLDAVAFARGPGAFTGLRVACATAQGLALGIGRPVLPLDGLLLVAEAARAERGDVDDWWVAMDARMDEVYAAAYRREGGRWQAVQAPALWTLEALNARWQARPPVAVAGSAPAAFGTRLALPPSAVQADAADRAGALMRLAQAAWCDGAAIDPAQALPLYLRDKVALTTAERAAAAAARDGGGR